MKKDYSETYSPSPPREGGRKGDISSPGDVALRERLRYDYQSLRAGQIIAYRGQIPESPAGGQPPGLATGGQTPEPEMLNLEERLIGTNSEGLYLKVNPKGNYRVYRYHDTMGEKDYFCFRRLVVQVIEEYIENAASDSYMDFFCQSEMTRDFLIRNFGNPTLWGILEDDSSELKWRSGPRDQYTYQLCRQVDNQVVEFLPKNFRKFIVKGLCQMGAAYTEDGLVVAAVLLMHLDKERKNLLIKDLFVDDDIVRKLSDVPVLTKNLLQKTMDVLWAMGFETVECICTPNRLKIFTELGFRKKNMLRSRVKAPDAIFMERKV